MQVSPDVVHRLSQLAREFHVQEQVVIPEVPNSPAEDWITQLLANHVDNHTLQEFRLLLSDLSPEEQAEVVALLWLGREDYTVEEWDDIVAEARRNWTPTTADYLIGHPLLGDYLESALDMLGYPPQDQ